MSVFSFLTSPCFACVGTFFSFATAATATADVYVCARSYRRRHGHTSLSSLSLPFLSSHGMKRTKTHTHTVQFRCVRISLMRRGRCGPLCALSYVSLVVFPSCVLCCAVSFTTINACSSSSSCSAPRCVDCEMHAS